jgi:hypothetical protein
VKILGAVHILKETGRPEMVYGVRACPNLRHDVLRTEFLIRYLHADVWCDPNEPPYPDAVMHLKQPYYVEICTGEETLTQLRKKFDAYAKADIEGWMLYCCESERRMRNVQRIAPEFCLVSTLRSVLDDPMGKIWEDRHGNRYTLS